MIPMAGDIGSYAMSFGHPIVLPAILERLSFSQIKPLSRVSKQIREACLPFLFHEVQCRFSKHSFDNLASLLNSSLRHHVVSFTYIVPGIIGPGRDPIQLEEARSPDLVYSGII